MADDWIKMRTDLYRDPKVCVIAELLMDNEGDLARYVDQNTQRYMSVTSNVLRNAAVGALVSIWGIVRHRGKQIGDDLLLPGVSLIVLDDIAEIPGFGKAMAGVGWAVEIEEGIKFPHFFEEFNAPPKVQATPNAERQRRFRDRKKQPEQATEPTPDESVTKSNGCNGREEKRREEKRREEISNANPLPPEMNSALNTPDFLAAWNDWESHRVEIKKKMTPLARQKQLKELASWGVARAIAAIELSIRSGWIGIHESNDKFSGQKGKSNDRTQYAYDPKLDPHSPEFVGEKLLPFAAGDAGSSGGNVET